MSLLRVAIALVIRLLATSPIVEAGPSDLSKIIRRNNGDAKHFRRQEYIEDPGSIAPVTITVPLNTVSSSNQTISPVTIKVPYTSIVASPFTSGGGDGAIISGGAFAGRRSGRGTRNEIYGTARYGSGYGTYKMWEGGRVEYTPELSLNVSGRDFPHGFPPLRFGNYSGGGNYANVELTDYPGITTLPTLTHTYAQDTFVNIYLAMKNNQTWFILADGATLSVLDAVLQLPVSQGGCDAKPFEPLPIFASISIYPAADGLPDSYTGSYYNINLWEWYRYDILPWHVLQFYRGSSIALGSHIYDNVAARNGNKNNTDYWSSSPLNTTGIDMNFLTCLNRTIAGVAPIVDPHLIIRQRRNQDPGQIAGIVIGLVAGLVLLLAAIWGFLRRRRRQKKQAAALAAATRASSIRRGVGIGEAPEDYELEDRHVAPPVYTAVDATVGSSRETHRT